MMLKSSDVPLVPVARVVRLPDGSGLHVLSCGHYRDATIKVRCDDGSVALAVKPARSRRCEQCGLAGLVAAASVPVQEVS